MFEKFLIDWAEKHPEELKNLLLMVYRSLLQSGKQELIQAFLGKELFEALQWCAECRKNNLDFAKTAEKT